MTDLGDLSWRFVDERAHDGPTNMALDEVTAETVADGGLATVRLYCWEPSTLSLGYNQDPATIDWDYCEREAITVTRRPTGGGAIYHDTDGDISYSIVVPGDAVPGDLLACYELLCEPILDAFEGMGVDATFASDERPAVYQPACYLRALHPAHDVVGPDGRKISGNAQYRQRDAVVQHGSLTFETTPARHCACFTGDPEPDAFADRVGGIEEYVDCSRSEAVATLRDTLREWVETTLGGTVTETSWPDEITSRARERVSEKFGTEAWTRERTDPTA
ncbi:biotin/lipoate A/B protein ligase family protein [Halomicrobium sp. HM KBTZ05]|uniref:lipoate--protein ligase family protein n=1 Tax=Halomicrobium sp. HM KBTZ05 TaxID=3242663 RepID=UPI003558E74C